MGFYRGQISKISKEMLNFVRVVESRNQQRFEPTNYINNNAIILLILTLKIAFFSPVNGEYHNTTFAKHL